MCLCMWSETVAKYKIVLKKYKDIIFMDYNHRQNMKIICIKKWCLNIEHLSVISLMAVLMGSYNAKVDNGEEVGLNKFVQLFDFELYMT